jgi:thioredoxin-related protein
MHRIHLTLLLLWLLPSHALAANNTLLPQSNDLKQLGRQASEQRTPILLMVSQYHCGYCEQMKNEVLYPMQLNGEYSNKVIMRELLIDPEEMVTNFLGQRVSADTFSDHYQVTATPTLLFLDHQGNEVAERILGINTIDYLFYYIEDAIETASAAVFTESSH